jgi:hypothetical protein
VRLDEVQAGLINHAIRFTVQNSDKSHLWPARHDAGSASNPNLPPMGARFRLKAGFNMSGFNAPTQVVLTAMKHYGLIAADNGSNWFFQGTTDSGWNSEPYATMVSQLKTVPASAFEAIDESSLMIDPNSGQAGQPGPSCTSATLTTTNVSPQPPGNPFAFTASATTCPSPLYKFWVLAPGGKWTMQRNYGGASWSWNTGGLPPGTYQIGVWARQPGTANAYDAFGVTTVVVGVNSCISAGLTPSPAAPQPRGTLITFNATATGCSVPRYQFWLLPPGGAWTSQGLYNTAASWQLDSSKYPAGYFQVGVWVRQVASASRYDSFFIASYAIASGSSCVVTGLSPSAASPQSVGTSMTFTPQQVNCTQQYKFLLLPPGGSWAVVQGYGVGGSWIWNSAGRSPGVYEVGVWEGSASSPSTYESFAITSFDLAVLTCTSAELAGPAQPQSAGTPIAFTATSTRCDNAQYEFWVLRPGGAWTLARGYGSPAWTWPTSGLAPGNYQVGVWARQSGSTNAHDAYFVETFQLS